MDCIEDKSQEDHGQAEGGGVMTPKSGTTINLTVTAASVPMSVDTKVDESILTRAPVDTNKTSSQPVAANSLSSGSNARTTSASTLSPSDALDAGLTPSFTRHKIPYLLKNCVKKIRSECTASTSAVFASSVLAATFSSSSKRPKMTESIQDGVKNMC